jgi:hypothetical protein
MDEGNKNQTTYRHSLYVPLSPFVADLTRFCLLLGCYRLEFVGTFWNVLDCIVASLYSVGFCCKRLEEACEWNNADCGNTECLVARSEAWAGVVADRRNLSQNVANRNSAKTID